MHHWMFNCREVTRLVSVSLDRELPLYQRMGLRFHLLMCKFCGRYRKQLLIMRETMRSHAKDDVEVNCPVPLSPETRKRMKEVLTDQLSCPEH